MDLCATYDHGRLGGAEVGSTETQQRYGTSHDARTASRNSDCEDISHAAGLPLSLRAPFAAPLSPFAAQPPAASAPAPPQVPDV